MANISFQGLDELEEMLENRGKKVDGVVNHMLNAGAKIMREEIKGAMDEMGLKRTGDMIKSVASTKIKKDAGGGKSISVYPQGEDRNGVRNMAKAAIAYYGKKGQPARPWKTVADERGGDKALKRMREIFNDEMDKAELEAEQEADIVADWGDGD